MTNAGVPGTRANVNTQTDAVSTASAGGQPRTLDSAAAASTPTAPAHRAPAWSQKPAAAQRSLEEMALSAIQHALDAAGGNISEASKQLDISRNTIYRKLRRNQGRLT